MSTLRVFEDLTKMTHKKAQNAESTCAVSHGDRTQINKSPKPIFYEYVYFGVAVYITSETWESCRGPDWYWNLMHADDVQYCCIPRNSTIINLNEIISNL